MIAVLAIFVGGSSFLKDVSDRLVEGTVFQYGLGGAEGTGVIQVSLGIGQVTLPQGADTHEEIPLGFPRLVLRLKETPQGCVGIGGGLSGKQIASPALGGGSGRRGKGRYDG